MTPSAHDWITDTVRLARRLPDAVATAVLAERYLERLRWTRDTSGAVPWIVFDGPSAVGKDTQIALVAQTLRSAGLTVRVVGGTGAGTELGPLIGHVVARNVAVAGASRWLADYRIKSAAWSAMRQQTSATTDVVLCNRGPLSQVVYSAVAGCPGLLDSGRLAADTDVRPRDLHLLLSCPDDVVVRRAGARIAAGEKARRAVDHPEFARAANQAFHNLVPALPWARAVDVSGTREENLAAIMRLVNHVIAPHTREAGEGADARAR